MDWFSGIGRRVWLAYQEGLEMTCPAHRECAKRSGQIAARDNATALPHGSAPQNAAFPVSARAGMEGPDNDGTAFHSGSSARH